MREENLRIDYRIGPGFNGLNNIDVGSSILYDGQREFVITNNSKFFEFARASVVDGSLLVKRTTSSPLLYDSEAGKFLNCDISTHPIEEIKDESLQRILEEGL